MILNDPTHHLSSARVMGILNTTPDSFSDGGRFDRLDTAVDQAMRMVEQGADIIDVGGESTRPGASEVPLDEEIARVVPVIQHIAAHTDTLISIDTSKPEVMQAAAEAGAGMINDVYALRRPGAMEMAAGLGVPVCLMHMQGEPRDMQHDPHYENVRDEVWQFLMQRVHACREAGIAEQHIILDPGFGFGKTLEHNIELFRALPSMCRGPYPVLVGVSRKSMLGQITTRTVDDRLAGSLAAAVLADQAGAKILRVHDVAQTVDALRVSHRLSE